MKQPANQQNGARPSFARRLAKWRVRLGLGHSPELDLFPTESDRNGALFDLSRHPGSPSSTAWWAGIGTYVVFVVSASVAIAWHLQFVNWPHWIELSLPICIAALGFALLRAFVQHRVSDKFLRHRLIMCGVPVCLHCGYCLRGMPDVSTICPECGKPIDPSAKKVMIRVNESPHGADEASA